MPPLADANLTLSRRLEPRNYY